MTTNAITHLEEAMKLLSLEAWRGAEPADMQPVEHYTIAEDLERVDRALGPRGSSMFAPIADAVRSAYVEVRAAHIALSAEPDLLNSLEAIERLAGGMIGDNAQAIYDIARHARSSR